jgi:hypothetical protein
MEPGRLVRRWCREVDRSGTLIGHASRALAIAIAALAAAMPLLSALALLVPAICGTSLLAPDCLAAGSAAVALPAIATRADKELGARHCCELQDLMRSTVVVSLIDGIMPHDAD